MEDSWLIRKATIRDIERVRKMQAQSWRDTYENKELGVAKDWLRAETDLWLTPNEIKKSEEFMRPFLEDEKNNFYRVAEVKNEIVGMIHANHQDEKWRLWGIYISSKYHGSGLAQELLDLANEWLGDNTVELEVASYNDRAKAFYRKNGFYETNEKREKYKNRIPIIKMIRSK